MLQSWTNALDLISAACTDSWRVDETYIKIKGTWTYLYRAVDSEGNTLEFLLSPRRDAEAAKRFFEKALRATAGSAQEARPVQEQVTEPAAPAELKTSPSTLRVINVEKNAAYPKAIADLKAAGMLPESVELRQVKYLNNLVGVSISNSEFCTLSKTGRLIDFLMWLQKRIEEKGCEVGEVYPLVQSFLVSISSRTLVWLSRPIHLLSVHFSRFDMLTPRRNQFFDTIPLTVGQIGWIQLGLFHTPSVPPRSPGCHPFSNRL
jgi:hypothetical protein